MPTATRDAEPTAVEEFLATLDELILYRYPHIIGPLVLAGGLLGVSYAAHRYADGWPIVLTIAAGVVVFLALDSVGRLPGQREKAYALTCWLAGAGWTVAAAWFGPLTGQLEVLDDLWDWTVPPLLAVWFVLLAVLMPPWVKHRRVRRGVEVSAQILAWDGDAVGLPDTTLSASGAKADTEGWEAPLISNIKGKYTLEKLRKAIPQIAARYEAAIADVTINKVRGDKEGKYVLRVRQKPHPGGGETYTVPDERPTIRKPFRIGKLAADETKPLMSEVWRKGHGGVDGVTAGQKGYGKTNYFRLLGLHAVASTDALLWLGDMKPGSPDYREIGPLGAHVYAKTQAEIDLMIRALLILCRVRGENPRPDRKVILVLLDETALYFAASTSTMTGVGVDARRTKAEAQRADIARLSRFDQLLAISRAFDIAVHCATQRGKESKLGGDARAAMLAGQVCGFFSPKPADSALLSGDKEFQLDTLPRGVKGECLISNLIHEDVTRGTQDYISDEVIREMLGRFGRNQEGLREDETRALEAELGGEWRALQRGNRARPAGMVVDAEPEPAGIPRRMASAEQSRQLVFTALAGLGRAASSGEVAEVLGKSPALVRARLAELVEEGRARKTGRGQWTKYEPLTGPQAPPADR